MIEYDSFIYLDVYRTGSTHIIGLLKRIADEKLVRSHRHAPLTKGRPHGLAGGKLVFASVRNPWDWYVSLWAYGAGGKSAIRRYLAAHLEPRELAALYDRSHPARSFRRWLALMHDPAFLDRIMQEHMPQSKLSPVIGLYTYRYLRVTTRFPRLFLRRGLIGKPADAARYHRFGKSYSHVLRNETLSGDLIALIETAGHRCRFKSNAADIIRKAEGAPRNSSPRTMAGYRGYYDDDSVALVATRDRFFTDVFDYRF